MARPDQRHTVPPGENGFGRFGKQVGANFGLWIDNGLGVEIGGTPASQPDGYISMGYVMPLARKWERTLGHDTLFVLPIRGRYNLVTARAMDPELYAPSYQPLQFGDWVVTPDELPLPSMKRNIGLFRIDETTLFEPKDALLETVLIQDSVDRALDRREEEERRGWHVDDRAIEGVLGPRLFQDLSRLRPDNPERRAS
jgi:hypothetical protein